MSGEPQTRLGQRYLLSWAAGGGGQRWGWRNADVSRSAAASAPAVYALAVNQTTNTK